MSVAKMLRAAVCALAFMGAAAAARAETIDTMPFWNGSDYIYAFGNPNTATYGQTFTAPGGALDSFTFALNPWGSTQQFVGQVYAWNGYQPTGPALYTSPSTSIAGNAFQGVTMNVGGLSLTMGDSYVAFLTVSNPADYAATTGVGGWGFLWSAPAVANNGTFVYLNNGNDPSALTTNAWSVYGGSLAWTAEFGTAAVPEPASLALFGAGLFGLGFVRRRRAG